MTKVYVGEKPSGDGGPPRAGSLPHAIRQRFFNGSVPRGDRVLTNIEPVVQADFDQMEVLPDVDINRLGKAGRSERIGEGAERIRPRAEVHVVVLQLPGDVVGEGKLDASTEHAAPSPMLLLQGNGRIAAWAFAAEEDIHLMPLVGPGQTALHVQHRAINGAAEPQGEAAERIDVRFD